ncbi:tubby C-terminal-like domain-containing protein [Thermothelomyces heterothallicus CBS 202.75]|uniref:tubby C-terminal-like domain-containing protein n=1 Tax=Thermothelomyces heterothallicus CBS 202.75 TaxID=1149848 RepID=UPI003744AE51
MASYQSQAASTTITNRQLVLQVEEMLNNFTIKDTATNKTFMRSKAKKLSMRGRMKVYDGNNNLLFDIIQKPFRMRPTFSIRGQDKGEIMRVKFGAMSISRTAHAKFTTAEGQPVKFTMKSSLVGGMSADIVQEPSKRPVAHVKRKMIGSGKTLLRTALGQDTYHVTVQPGVDAALIVAMCICWDTKKEQQQRR